MTSGRGPTLAVAFLLLMAGGRSGMAQRGTDVPPVTPPEPPRKEAKPPREPVARGGGGIATEAKPRPGETPEQTKQRVLVQFRRALANRVRQQLVLNDGQMTQLMKVDASFEQRRRELDVQYNQTILEERRTMNGANPDSPENQKALTDLDHKARQIHSQLDDADSSEAVELQGFLTPAQRIKFAAIKQNLERTITSVSGMAIFPDLPARGLRRGGPAVTPDSID